MQAIHGDKTADADTATMVEVQLALGQMYLDRREHDHAADTFRAAARSGDPRALNMMGRCLERGWGVQADPALAARYYQSAAELGDVWAMFNLADAYCRGSGVGRDNAAAYTLYMSAARNGHVKSLNMLGLFHEDGRIGPADLDKAMEFYRGGAEGGDCWAQFNLARVMLSHGDVDDALPWIDRALDCGFSSFHRSMAQLLMPHPLPQVADYGRRALQLAEAAERVDG